MNAIKNTVLTAVAGILLCGASAQATPTWVGSTLYGGHVYDLYADAGVSWGDAQAFAVTQNGNLAVLTTTAEIQGVYNGLINKGFFTDSYEGQAPSAWVGGQPNNPYSTTSKEEWNWVTGEPWTQDDINNWAGSEPNGDSGGLTINRYANFSWNDDTYVGGFIVESVPDAASTLTLMGGAFALIGAYNRKFRK